MICPVCGRPGRLVSQQKIYGRNYGNDRRIWACAAWPTCDTYVGCHPGSGVAVGSMAGFQLRRARQAAHAAFDPLWKVHNMKRGEAYSWISKDLGYQVHIGESDEQQCEVIRAWALQRRKELADHG